MERRIEAARWMYAKRFPGNLPPGLSIEQLRGLEGARVKAMYALAAKKHRLNHWHRNRGELGEMDPVNIALNYANTALYGLVNSVVLALGLSPGLGVVHEGQRQAFVLDIADLYKADMTIPLAFSLWRSEDAGRDVMHALRKNFRLLRLLPRIVDDVYELLGHRPDPDQDDGWSIETLNLWAPSGLVVAGVNYADRAILEDL
jgi:CRISPR-associated protein Cas1